LPSRGFSCIMTVLKRLLYYNYIKSLLTYAKSDIKNVGRSYTTKKDNRKSVVFF
jgi:hypothetical protein